MVTVDTIKKAMSAFNRHDAKGVGGSYAPKTVVHDPQYPEPLKGRDAVLKDAQAFFKAFPDMKMKVVTLLSKGNTYGVEGRYSGTHKGPLEVPGGPIPPTNRRVDAGISIFGKVDAGGLIVEERRYYDIATLMAQLGIKSGS